MPYELYKLNNIFRAICIAVMPVNTYGGMIPLFILQLIFVIADAKLYRQLKINKKTFFVDRALMIGVLIGGILLSEYIPLVACLCSIVLIIYAIKVYYMVLMIQNWIAERKKRQLSDVAESEAVNQNSVKLDEDDLSKNESAFM